MAVGQVFLIGAGPGAPELLIGRGVARAGRLSGPYFSGSPATTS
jgi:hypothetical protein